jgi:hypothetical protein
LKNPITAWSYSRLSTFRACKLQFRFQYIDKLPQPKSPAMDRGTEIHLAIQNYIEKKTKILPTELTVSMGQELLIRYTEMRKSKNVACELELAVDKNWKRVEWYAKDAWLRVKLDVVELAGDSLLLDDHKTGKIREGQHTEQLEIYAAIAPSFWPEAKEIIARMDYVDQGQDSISVFTKATAMKLRQKWAKLAGPIFKEKEFPASPGQVCRYCSYSRRRGGPCVQG